MATTTSIFVLLKFFAGRQNSAAIDFGEFTEYLKRYSEHHLEEQPSLVNYMTDTANVLLKELEKLSANHQVLILSPTAEKKIIIVIAFFIEKFSIKNAITIMIFFSGVGDKSRICRLAESFSSSFKRIFAVSDR